MRLLLCVALLCLLGTVRALDDADAAESLAPVAQQEASTPPVLSETDAKATVSRFRAMLNGDLKPLLDDSSVKKVELASKLNLDDIPDDETKQKLQHDRELSIAAAAAQKQAEFDAWNFQNAMRFREIQRRHKRHLRHKKKMRRLKKGGNKEASKMRFREKKHRRNHHHKHHVHHFQPYPPVYGSFFQQYYAHPRFQQVLAEDEEEDDEEDKEDKKDDEELEDEAEKNRFQQMQAAAREKAKREQSVWHALEYGNSQGGPAGAADAAAPGAPEEQESAPAAGNAYGMPLAKDPVFPKQNHELNFGGRPSFLTPPGQAPGAAMRFQEVHAQTTSQQPMQAQGKAAMEQMTTSMFQPRPAAAAPAPMAASMRFQQVSEPQTESQVGNPNPGGVPMPFYPPSQAPPPAPNQSPAASAMQAAMYPQNLVVAPSIGGGLANAGTQGTAATADRFMANNPNAAVNQYPFNSFLEMDESEMVHPTVHKMAYNPYRHLVRTPLTEEHMQEFPLLQ